MSTSSFIAIKTEDGCKTIYCHNDGHPAYMLKMLRDNYNSKELAEKLIAFGDASSIKSNLEPTTASHDFFSPAPNVCIFYNRDRGDDWRLASPKVYTKEELLKDGFNFNYIFEDGTWNAYDGYRRL